jgi:predicted transposase/invertase (TIGR01784 family)
MQWARQEHFLERAMSHISMLVGDLAKRDDDWDFELPKVYFVGILDFDYQHSLPEKYLHKIQWRDDDPQHIVSLMGPEFLLLELPKFKLKAQDLHSDMEKWCFLLKNMGSLDEIPVTLNTDSFKKLFEVATVANYSKKKFNMYKQSLLAKQNQYACLKTARNDGKEEGREEEAQKARKNTEMSIRRLLSDNRYSVSEISEIIGWSRESIQEIKDSMA